MTHSLMPGGLLPGRTALRWSSLRPETRILIASLGIVAAITAVVLFAVLRSPMKDDLAWLLYVARQWLRGRELYVDIVEVNPPLIVWISAVPVMLADLLGLTAKQVALPIFAAFALGCSWWSAALLKDTGPVFRHQPITFAVIAAVLMVSPGIEFGQREHLMTMAVLPHLCLLVRVLEGKPARLANGLGTGLVAGIGCALKPRYILTLAAVELIGWARGGPKRRAAPWVACLASAGYLALVMLVYPTFFDKAVPLALTLYGATNTGFFELLLESWKLLLGIGVCGLLTWRAGSDRPGANVQWVLLGFMVTATLVMLLDGKNWFYHRIPATIAMVLSLLYWCADAYLAREGKVVDRWRPALMALVAIPLLMQAQKTSERLYERLVLAVEPENSTEVKLERLIRREKAKTYVAFSEWIGLGFPVVNNTDVTWASRFDSMWALRGELWRTKEDGGRAPKDWPIRRWVARDFVTGCPDIVVVDRRESINYPAVLTQADERFADAWARYAKIAEFDGLQIFRRQGEGCSEPEQEAIAQ